MAKKRRSDRSLPSPQVVRRSIPIVRVVGPRIVVQRPAVNMDARTFHPMGKLRPVPAAVRAARRLVPARVREQPRHLSFKSLSAHVGFDIPEKVKVCVRRKERREVLFAKRKARKGARSLKIRNIWSAVRC